MFDQLYYFSEVYRCRSISHAAEILHISRQALSQSIRNLETQLGVDLFIRKRDGVVPTMAADLLFESAKVILNEERIIKNNMLSLSWNNEVLDKLLISAPQAYVTCHGDSLVSQLSEKFPEKSFVLKTIRQSEDADISKYDINIMSKLSVQNRVSMKVPSRYYCRKLLTLPVYVWVNRAHPLVYEEAISYHSLRPYTMCVLKNTFNGIEILRILGLDYDPVVEISNNFRDKILKDGCWTLDVHMAKEHLMFEDFFGNDERFVQLETVEYTFMYIIFRKDIDERTITFISNFVTDSLTK